MKAITFIISGIMAGSLVGCGGASLCEDNGVTVTIADNHPNGDHKLDVPATDVAAGEEVTYDIQGDNTGHGIASLSPQMTSST